jgi:hypothetical protein
MKAKHAMQIGQSEPEDAKGAEGDMETIQQWKSEYPSRLAQNHTVVKQC